MTEVNRARVLKESVDAINKLQLFSTFFENEVVYRIYLRSQIIHRLFENNIELDVNSLELFHAQFTSSLNDLLRQVKKANEQKVSIIYDEIELNEELIAKLESNQHSERSFNSDKTIHLQLVNQSIENLYNNLSDYSADQPILKNIRKFETNYAREFYHDINGELFLQLTDFETEDIYKNAYAIIHKKLMGLQCKYGFKNSFIGGLRADENCLEVYQITGTNNYFVFYPAKNLFLQCVIEEIKDVDWTNTSSKMSRIINELKDKAALLESQVKSIKTKLTTEVQELLNDYYEKIEDVNFLDNIANVDVQANILKAMLNTDSL